MIKYIDLGADKQLHEIVMAGSHDAGITGGGKNVQTQSLSIGGQAEAGVRFFDLRVAATTAGLAGVGPGGMKGATLKAFHADKKLMKNKEKVLYIPEAKRAVRIDRTKLRGGAFGEGLEKMLNEARDFVEKNKSEFLILKFDKCLNWELIAEVCVHVLGPVMYKGPGNINTKRLRDLQGKVICLFPPKGLLATSPHYKGVNGVQGIINLYEGGSYNPKYDGLQYYGKGGTSPFKPFRKIKQNESKQYKLMRKGIATDPEVLGMMYWTTTGLTESIRKRNEKMWADGGFELKMLWRAGLYESIKSRLPSHVNATSYSSGPVLKVFMPNIVMIDFANSSRCKTIYELNQVAGVQLTRYARNEEEAEELSLVG